MTKSSKEDEEYNEFLAWKARKEKKKNKPTEIKDKYPVSKIEKDPERIHMYVVGIRILNVSEYKKLLSVIPKKIHINIFDILMMTGIRYEEMLRLYDNENWYMRDLNLIHLPEEAMGKAERKQLERDISPLPISFPLMMDIFFENRRPPTQVTWDTNMKRWAEKAGMSPFGMSVKTTRKTLESWMYEAGVEQNKICLRQGHDSLTSLKHYQGRSFSDIEKYEIRKQLEAWNLSN